VINAKENVPAVMPETSSFGEMSGDEESSAGMMPGKSASSANNSQNANPKATPLNGQEVPELPVTPIDGESVATSVASGDAVAVSEDVDADDASRSASTKKNPAGAISKASGGLDAKTDSGAEFGSGTAQDNDASELFWAQFTQTGNGGVDNIGAVDEGDPIASGRDTAINSQESLSAKSGPEFISAEAKGNSEIQATAKDQQVVSPLRARVQEQVLETAVARVSLAIRDKVSHARIRLDPPSLGRVDMQLRVEDGSLTAKVTVESAWVKDAITANLKDLHDALEEHGVKVEAFTVDVDSGMASWGSDQAFDGDEADGALYLESNSLEEEETDSTLAGADSFSPDADGDSSTLDLFA
jgi:flagellar hook-length control protein FliK